MSRRRPYRAPAPAPLRLEMEQPDQPRCRYVPGFLVGPTVSQATPRSRALLDHHTDDCPGTCQGCAAGGTHRATCTGACRGCQPCPGPHCRLCGINHDPHTCPACLTALRDDLDTIDDHQNDLAGTAYHGGRNGHLNASSPIPGGDALAAIAPATPVTHHRDPEWAADHTPDDLHPLLVLATWADAWRDWWHLPTPPGRATTHSEARWLDDHLTGIGAARPRLNPDGNLEQPPDIDDMRRDLTRLRNRIEDLTRTGQGARDHRSRVPCLDCGQRLDHDWDDQGRPGAICSRCHRVYDERAWLRAQADWLHSRLDGDPFIELAMAADALGRPVRTVRGWVRDGHVTACCLLTTRTVAVWWPDVRRLDVIRPTRPTRRRSRAALPTDTACA